MILTYNGWILSISTIFRNIENVLTTRCKEKSSAEDAQKGFAVMRDESTDKIVQPSQHELLPYPSAFAEISDSGDPIMGTATGTKSILLQVIKEKMEFKN